MVIFIAETSRLPAQAPARLDRLRRLPQERFRSRSRALISSTAFMAWSDTQILPRLVAHMRLEEAQAGLAVGRAFKINCPPSAGSYVRRSG